MASPAVTQALTIGALAAAALAPMAWAVIKIRRSPFTPAQTLLAGLNYLMTRVLWGARVSGPLPVRPDQGAVIVCNHRSSVDPAFIFLTVNRAVHWMVAKEYCEKPLFGWLLRLCEVIPVSRGGMDTAATKMAIRCAQQGGLVGVFPEGRINQTQQTLLSGRSGAALIALKARVPVIPCYLEGSPYDGTPWGCVLMPAKVRLEVGQPIDLSPYYGRQNEREVLEEVTKRLLVEIARLGGRAGFQPELAGRFYKPED
jgi:1-acyl-sn-glycerol-3-phosphate acyltransferase